MNKFEAYTERTLTEAAAKPEVAGIKGGKLLATIGKTMIVASPPKSMGGRLKDLKGRDLYMVNSAGKVTVGRAQHPSDDHKVLTSFKDAWADKIMQAERIEGQKLKSMIDGE